MPPQSINTNQHYVPQLLLRAFSIEPNSEQVHVFDKRNNRKFISTIRNLAAERGYYDFDETLTLDESMSKADNLAAPIIDKIRERRSVGHISPEDRSLLATFVMLQHLRTRGSQEQRLDIGRSLATKLQEMGAALPGEFEKYLESAQQRDQYLRSIPKNTKDFARHLINKDLLLFETSPEVPFCISDNPVALNNTINPSDGLRGTLGFAVPGIEIYLPVSSELTLAYLCPLVGTGWEMAQERLRSFGGFIGESAYYFLQARDIGKPVRLTPDNVRFQNSLQVIHAERFVISSKGDFADATYIVAGDPAVRFGPRVTTN